MGQLPVSPPSPPSGLHTQTDCRAHSASAGTRCARSFLACLPIHPMCRPALDSVYKVSSSSTRSCKLGRSSAEQRGTATEATGQTHRHLSLGATNPLVICSGFSKATSLTHTSIEGQGCRVRWAMFPSKPNPC